jgi:hypothetical protein
LELTTRKLIPPAAVALSLVGFLAVGCGSAKHARATTARETTSTRSAPPTTSSAHSPNALQGEAASAATGDIPDDQKFVRFVDPQAGYTMKYPEGWARNGSGTRVTFRDKNNVVRVIVQPARLPTTPDEVRAELTRLRRATPSLQIRQFERALLGGASVIKVVYTTLSSPNAVTNKRVDLMVDRYYLARGRKRAIVDLGTPVGVDNVDAYRLMIQSFRWR